ncbi:hypothetical protein ACA910_014513 [Epithemia clementina (nom. ined.)]
MSCQTAQDAKYEEVQEEAQLEREEPLNSLQQREELVLASKCGLEWERRVQFVRKFYEAKGYRVHSGLQFGCELVLYADDPSKVHSDFCVHVVPEDELLDWRMMQSLVRSMPDLHKTLILANPTIAKTDDGKEILVELKELAFATEHAPFRHRRGRAQVGSQRKKKMAKTTAITSKPATALTESKDAATVHEHSQAEASTAQTTTADGGEEKYSEESKVEAQSSAGGSDAQTN